MFLFVLSFSVAALCFPPNLSSLPGQVPEGQEAAVVSTAHASWRSCLMLPLTA